MSIESLRRLIVPVVFVLVCLAFYWPVTLYGLSPSKGDIPLQFLPWKMYWQESILQGRVPLWNPYVACGAPFLANMQSAVFYPVDWLLLFAPPKSFFGFSLLIHTFLALGLTYLLARSLSLSRIAASIAALAYAFSGFNHIHLMAGNFLTFSASVWLPLLWLATRNMIREVSRKEPTRRLLVWPLLIAMGISLQVLCGHPQMAFYSLFFTFLWILGLTLQTAGRNERWQVPLRSVGLYIISGLLTGLICAVQLIPTFEYIAHSSRAAQLSFDEATQFSFSFSRILSLPFADLFGSNRPGGDYWGYWKDWSSAYVGFWPCLLALLAVWEALRRIVKNRKKEDISGPSKGDSRFPFYSCVAVAGVGLLLALGRHQPLYRYVLDLPGFGQFRAPSKFLPGFILPVSLLAAAGWDNVVSRWFDAGGKAAAKDFAWKTLTLVLLAILGAAAAILIELQLTPQEHLPVILRSLWTAALFFFGGFLLISLGIKFPRGSVVISLAFVALIGVDLYQYGFQYFQFGDPSRRIKMLEPVYQDIPLAERSTRVLAPEVLRPNEAVALRIEVPGWYDPMSVRRYSRWLACYSGLNPDKYRDGMTADNLRTPAADFIGLGLRSGAEGRSLNIAIRPNAFPRAVFYPLSAARMASFPWIFDPSSELFLSEANTDVTENESLPTAEAFIRRFSDQPIRPPEQPTLRYDRLEPGNKRIDYQTKQAGYIFISETFYPGWRFTLDGREELRIFRANYAFQAVRVPQGTHSITIEYRPRSFVTGCALSVLGISLIIASISVTYGFARRRKERPFPE